MQSDAEKRLGEHWSSKPEPKQRKVFICFEMLEHLARPEEIFHHYVKAGGDFDTILLSTPMYTYGGGMPNWYECDLGHLRTYTPREFLDYAKKHWPFHKWELQTGPVMCLIGEK
jgi:hypothetical protein